MDIQTTLFILVVIDVVSSLVRAIVDVLEYKQNHKPKRKKPHA
jgi:hypothetical protein